MNATAVTLDLACEKAQNLKSQGFVVDIRDEDGEHVLTRLN
jgi:hypothetical protein